MNNQKILVVILFILIIVLLCSFAYKVGYDKGRIKRMEEELQKRQENNNFHNKNNVSIKQSPPKKNEDSLKNI